MYWLTVFKCKTNFDKFENCLYIRNNYFCSVHSNINHIQSAFPGLNKLNKLSMNS